MPFYRRNPPKDVYFVTTNTLVAGLPFRRNISKSEVCRLDCLALDLENDNVSDILQQIQRGLLLLGVEISYINEVVAT